MSNLATLIDSIRREGQRLLPLLQAQSRTTQDLYIQMGTLAADVANGLANEQDLTNLATQFATASANYRLTAARLAKIRKVQKQFNIPLGV